jgi:N utilization substance protein A
MKSEFALAFNQICAEYNLPRDIVLEAVEAALVTAYRRDWKVSSNQNIAAEISMETGLAKIYLEKEVVEEGEVEDPLAQIAEKRAQRKHPKSHVGDHVMVDVTPRNFGRIAAQTAKQVITQRLREAERDSQYNRFSRQANEIIIGTVQSIAPHGITLHLERTEEAHMPRREQIPGERYSLHQKIRVYVVDVRRTPRGPQITVSRSHPNMLRRLMELEVPEIRAGQVEIKAIAREAGTRAKIAVISRQEGLDPVGACVGMRGIRIQTISRELNGERIDILEWAPEMPKFVANALSIDRVVSVILDENAPGGRTASVVVMDDHLSLAIGRSGQNARLAAKLTGWRVDIQGITEAAIWALQQINEAPEILANEPEVVARVPRLANIVRSHETDRYPYSDEEVHIIRDVVEGVRTALIAQRERERPGSKQARARREAQEKAKARKREAEKEARATVPAEAYAAPLEALDLSEKLWGHLRNNELENVGEVMERIALGDEALLMLTGVGAKALNDIKEAVEQSDFHFATDEEEERAGPAEEPEAAVSETEALAETEPPEVTDVEALAAEVVEIAAEVEVEEEPLPVAEVEVQEEVVTTEVEAEAEEVDLEEAAEEEGAEEPDLEPIPAVEDEEEEEPIFTLEEVLDAPPRYEYEEEENEEIFEKRGSKKRRPKKRKRHTLVYDEDSGETFAVRKRKRSPEKDWEEYLDV